MASDVQACLGEFVPEECLALAEFGNVELISPQERAGEFVNISGEFCGKYFLGWRERVKRATVGQSGHTKREVRNESPVGESVADTLERAPERGAVFGVVGAPDGVNAHKAR